MNLKIVKWRSLKTRVTVATLAIFLISIWSLAFYVSRMLREDMERLLGDQQFSTASFIAAEINDELHNRLNALEMVAARVGPGMLGNPSAMQASLEDRPVLLGLFNAGVVAYRLDGTAIAEAPLAAERISANYLDVDALTAALIQGKSTIGRPIMGKTLPAAVFGMTVPIRDAQGKVIGALAGVTNLGQPNFLDRVTQGGYGKTGAYLLAAPQHNLFVTASDKSRVMRPLPAPGVNPMHDKYAHGYEGYGVLRNFRGEEELTAAKGIPVAGWFMGIALPTTEAFAPIRALQQRMLIATIVLTLIAGILVWWLLRRQLSPMLRAVQQLAEMSDESRPLRALPVVGDEIGDLVGGFNRLLEILGHREAALKESEFRLRAIIENEPECIKIVDAEGRLRQMNPAGLAMIEADSWDQVAGRPVAAMVAPEYRSAFAELHRRVLAGESVQMNFEVIGLKGGRRWLETNAVPMLDKGALVHLAVTRDVTDRKQAEADLRIAAAAFESQEGMVVTDASSVILRINKAFTEITGYSADEIVGQTPRLLRSGRHDADFYRVMWETINRTGGWKGEIWDRRKNGEVYPKWLSITAVKDEQGVVTHYIGTHYDITERKKAEEQVQQLAFYDTLTKLPNRRLLDDRLSQTMAASKRSACFGALIFLDLDNFKPLNDRYGHAVGDLLLMEAAQRLKSCVREVDTVARFGGDEFVVVLSDLNVDRAESIAEAERVAEKIRIALAKTYLLTIRHETAAETIVEHRCTASIGVALFISHEASQDDILKWADTAMYRAKAAGRDAIRFYAAEV